MKKRAAGRPSQFGALYDDATGLPVTLFTVPEGAFVRGISFDTKNELDGAARGTGEVLVYDSEPVGELRTGTPVCAAGADVGSAATFTCSLKGEVDPFGVSGTEAWFQWGSTPAFGSETAKQPVADGNALVAVPPVSVEGLRPNETFYTRLAGDDANVAFPELLVGETVSFATPVVPPRVVGVPSASFVGASSAVLSGELDPENASTTYEFQYGACATLEGCPTLAETPAQQSTVYGNIGATLEASALQAATTYRYRLVAVNSEHQEAVGPEGQFTTTGAPTVSAQTGPVSAVGTGSAVISGVVDPDGRPASYTFELGVYAGEQTSYGVVFSGALPASLSPVGESLVLTGLQPGTAYAYRISISSPGFGQASGAPVVFTTEGLPAVLGSPAALALLATPNVAFPAAAGATVVKHTTKPVKCARGKQLSHGRCVLKKSVKRKTAKRAKKSSRRRR